jgi:hypothetical protein
VTLAFTRAANSVSVANAATQTTTITASASGCFLVVCCFSAGNHTVTGVTDNLGNTYTHATGSAANQGAARVSDIWYHMNPGAGVTSVTVTWSVSDATVKEAIVLELQGAATFDTASSLNNIASAATQTGAAVTPTTTSSAVVTCLRTAGTVTGLHAGSSFTTPANGLTSNTNAAAYEITTATSAQSAQWDLSVAAAGCSSSVVFKETSHVVTGRGNFALSSPVWLSITITGRPSRLTSGAAEPPNWYHVGLVSWGTANGAMETYPVTRDLDLVQLPPGMTMFWYNFASGVTATVNPRAAP